VTTGKGGRTRSSDLYRCGLQCLPPWPVLVSRHRAFRTQVTAVAQEDTPHAETPSEGVLQDVTTTAVPTESYSRRQKYLDITITLSSSVGPTTKPKVINLPALKCRQRSGTGGKLGRRMPLLDAPSSQHRGGTICATDAKSRSKTRMSQPVIFRSACCHSARRSDWSMVVNSVMSAGSMGISWMSCPIPASSFHGQNPALWTRRYNAEPRHKASRGDPPHWASGHEVPNKHKHAGGRRDRGNLPRETQRRRS
jgi:hypothetical protein